MQEYTYDDIVCHWCGFLVCDTCGCCHYCEDSERETVDEE